MFYWSKNANKLSLESELISLKSIKEVFIGTAFFSKEGLRILKAIISDNGLKKNKVHIYLSNEFTQDKPYELLKELCDVAQVKIFFNQTFHAKVYLLRGKINKALFGSSNFTAGGFSKNIEFDYVGEINDAELNKFESFFEYCDLKAIEVTEEIIQYYKDNQTEIEELGKVQKQLKRKMKGYILQDDAMNKLEYDIDDYYFNFDDYETFFKRNEKRDDIEIREKRKVVQGKMLAIHNRVKAELLKLNLNCHWNPQNITSLIRPSEFNKGKVSWLGIRYGKTKDEINAINQNLDKNEKDEIKGFQKHGCMQFSIGPKGFYIELFLAVRHDAIDRAHVQDNMERLQPQITKEISKLLGHGMIWEIYSDTDDDYHKFDFDKESPDEFCKFLLKYDREGYESFLSIFYAADDKEIYTLDSISETVVFYINMLNPLYKVMVWRPDVEK